MSVLIDFRPNNRTGIYRYGMEIISRLIKKKPRKYIIFCPFEIKNELLGRINDVYLKDLSFIEAEKYGLVRNSSKIKKIINDRKIRLVYSVNYLLELDLNVPFIFTIHDLLRIKQSKFCYSDREINEKYNSQDIEIMKKDLEKVSCPTFQGNIFFLWLQYATKILADRSEKIITVSKSSKNDICSLLNIKKNKIIVSYCGVGNTFKYKRSSSNKNGDPYFLYVGLAKSHKRLDWIIKRWKNIFPNLSLGFELRIVGQSLELEKQIKPLVRELELQKTVKFEGYVKDSDLAKLYLNACSLLIASSEEGFCLPAAEAVAYGCPVIACDIPVLREILGKNAIFVGLNEENNYEKAILDIAFGREIFMLNNRKKNYYWGKATSVVHKAIEKALTKI